MLGVDERGVGRLREIVPLSRRSFTARVLGRSDDFEILVPQLDVEFLPTWQIKTAASP